MLVCNVSLRPPRRAIAAELAEAGIAADALATGNVVFATLVDDPASVGDIVDAYLGEIMLEAASADSAVDGNLVATYNVSIAETATAADTCSAVTPTAVWDLATVTDTALSNNNLTATHTTANANSGAKVMPAQTTGKYYFEIKLIDGHGSFDAMGLITSGASYNTFGIAGGSNCVAVSRGGSININSVNSGSIGAFTAGADVLGVAVDLTAHKVWCRRNAGNWNGVAGADPAAGTNGLTIASLNFSPCVCFVGSGTAINDAYTANFGATAYANAAPSGFGNWPP